MLEVELEYYKSRLQDFMNLRSTYFAIVITLTGGIISLFNNLTLLNKILIVLGTVIDYFFLIQIFVITKQMRKILKIIRSL